MHRPQIRLIDLFAHWRDQALYDLEAVIGYLTAAPRTSVVANRDHHIITVTFNINPQGRPVATRHRTSLRAVLRKYAGGKGSRPMKTTALLHTLRLERERLIRALLHGERLNLSRVLDPAELATLRAMPTLRPGPAPLVAQLLHNASAHTTEAECLTFPATLMAQALASPPAQALLGQLQSTLAWSPQEASRPSLRPQDLALLTIALPWALDPNENFHGFDFHAPALAGLAITDVLGAMRDHLIPRLHNCPASTFGLLRYLLCGSAPPELSLLGLPGELSWVTSVTWVLLSQGVTLQEVMAPGTCEQLSLDDALQLPLTVGMQAGGEAAARMLAATLLPGVMQWNIALQRIGNLPAPMSVERAFTMFLARLDAFDHAATALQAERPDRLAMARAEMTKRGISETMRFVNTTDRVRQSLLGGAGVSALEAVASGRAWGQPPVLVPALVQGHDQKLYEPCCDAGDIPDINARFETAFSSWTRDTALAVRTMIERLLGDLPLEDQLRLDQLPCTLCQLAKPAPATGETLLAPYGFVIHVTGPSGAWLYAMVPTAGWCRVQATAYATLVTSSTEVPRPTELPFDWEAFATGGLPDPDGVTQGWLAPLTRFDAVTNPAFRIFRNTRLLARACERAVAQTLTQQYATARGELPSLEAPGVPEAVKALVPLWTSIETIRQGYEEKRGWLVLLGLIGIGLDVVTLGTLGRLSALGVRFLALALRQGTRAAARQLTPRLRSGAREAVETLLPPGSDPQAPTPVADLGLILTLRKRYGAVLGNVAQRLASSSDAHGFVTRPMLPPFQRPMLHLRHFEDDTRIVLHAPQGKPAQLIQPRMVDHRTTLPYGPVLDVVDDTGRVGRLPLQMPLHTVEGKHYFIDPAPSLPKRWFLWGDETWLECSGRFYRVRKATAGETAALVQAPSPYGRPSLSSGVCRLRRVLPPLHCANVNERRTASFTEINPDTDVSPGAVDWFDERRIFMAEDGRFVDGGLLQQARAGVNEPIEPLSWGRYRHALRVRRLGGNDIFQRIEVLDGLVEGIDDRRQLSAVRLIANSDERPYLIACVDDGVYYHGPVSSEDELVMLQKLPERATDEPGAALADELKTLFDGCWDANLHIRRQGAAKVEEQLRQIEASLAGGGVDVRPLMTQRFRLSTTEAQAVLFARHPRREFISTLRKFVAADYTNPLTAETPLLVRQQIATHLNRLIAQEGAFDAQKVLDAAAIANAPPKGKNIAFLSVKYSDGRPEEVFYSASGAARRKTDLPLGKRFSEPAEGSLTSPSPWIASDDTRYFNCRGEGALSGEETLLHLPDLSKPGDLATMQTNDRRLDSERNILAHFQRKAVAPEAIAEAMLFTRFPTCESCTTLIAEYRRHFPANRFAVYEGPSPALQGVPQV